MEMGYKMGICVINLLYSGRDENKMPENRADTVVKIKPNRCWVNTGGVVKILRHRHTSRPYSRFPAIRELTGNFHNLSPYFAITNPTLPAKPLAHQAFQSLCHLNSLKN